MNLQFIRFVNERERTICYCKKQIGVSVPCVCPVIDNEFRRNIIKVVSGSIVTLTMVFMKFMIKNRTDAWKIDVNLWSRANLVDERPWERGWSRASARSEKTGGRKFISPLVFLSLLLCKSLRWNVDVNWICNKRKWGERTHPRALSRYAVKAIFSPGTMITQAMTNGHQVVSI